MGERGLPKCKGIESCLLEDNLKQKNPQQTKNHQKNPQTKPKTNPRKTAHR